MCTVAAAATGSLVLGAVGLGMQAMGRYQQNKASNQAAEYNAQIYERNAQMADMQARQAVEKGDIEEKQHRLRVSQMQGTQRAAFGGSGVTTQSGSAIDVLQDTAELAEQDAMMIDYNSQMQAWKYKNQAGNYQSQASLQRTRQTSPWLGVGGTVLSGASNLAGNYAQYKYYGAM